MSGIESTEAQTLRRRALWFRQFGRMGASPDRLVQEGVAETLLKEAAKAEQRSDSADQVAPARTEP